MNMIDTARRPVRSACIGVAVALLSCASASLWAQVSIAHPFTVAQPANAPDELLMVVEIPAGGAIKYEIGDDGLLYADRFLSMPMVYPANYGALPRTLAGDGDPLDVLVISRAPLQPGTLLRFRALGYLKMSDAGEADEKLIGVPVDAVDPTYAGVRELTDLPMLERQRIEAFFRSYKTLPNATNPVRIDGWGDATAARRLVVEARQRYEAAAAR